MIIKKTYILNGVILILMDRQDMYFAKIIS